MTFKMNSKCEILIDNDNSIYKSTIQDVGDNYIAISIPIANGKYAPLTKNEQVMVIYYSENNLYGFNTNVLDRKKDTVPLIILNMPDSVKKIQRRKFFRINLLKNAFYLKVNENISDSGFNTLIKDIKEFSSGILVDLSGGGLKLKTKNEIKAGDTFIIKIQLHDEDVFILNKCIRVDKEMDSNLYVAGFSFININTKVQDKIIAYVFWLMREQMKKI